MSKAGTSFNTVFSEDDHLKLVALADKLRISRAAVVRQLVSNAHSMVLLQRPTCADGRPCLVPHVHGPAQVEPPPPHEPAATGGEGKAP